MFPLSQLKDAIATVITAGGWTRCVEADTPTPSAQAHRSFAFLEPTPGQPTAWASNGQLRVYSWPVRFVWHLSPSSDNDKDTAVLSATEAMTAVQYGTNWQADLETLGVEPKPTTATGDEPRVLVMTWVLRAQVFEARPAF